MKISEAFEQTPNLVIDYVFLDECICCHKVFETIDEEYSFDGNREYFEGRWQQEYGVMDIVTEVDHTEGNHYVYKTYDGYDNYVCESCEQKGE